MLLYLLFIHLLKRAFFMRFATLSILDRDRGITVQCSPKSTGTLYTWEMEILEIRPACWVVLIELLDTQQTCKNHQPEWISVNLKCRHDMGIVKELCSFSHLLAMVSSKENMYDQKKRCYPDNWIQVWHLCPQLTQLIVNFGVNRNSHTRIWRLEMHECYVFHSLTFCVSSVLAEMSQVMGPLQFLFQGYGSRTIIKSLAFKCNCQWQCLQSCFFMLNCSVS